MRDCQTSPKNPRSATSKKAASAEAATQAGRMASAIIDAVSLSGSCDRLALIDRGFSESEIDACADEATEIARRRFVRRLEAVQ